MEMKIHTDKIEPLLEGTKNVLMDPREVVLNLKDDRWFVRGVDSDMVLMFGMRVLASEMEYYNPGDTRKIGLRLESLDDFIGSDEGVLHLEYNRGALDARLGGLTGTLSCTDPEYISGDINNTPNIDFVATIQTDDIGFISDFARRCDTTIDSNVVRIGVREGALYLQSYNKEGQDMLARKYEWDGFDEYNIDWGSVRQDQHSPYDEANRDTGIDIPLSVEWMKNMPHVEDGGTIFLQNQAFVKFLYDTEDGVDASHFIAPRYDSELINNVVEDEEVEKKLEES